MQIGICARIIIGRCIHHLTTSPHTYVIQIFLVIPGIRQHNKEIWFWCNQHRFVLLNHLDAFACESPPTPKSPNVQNCNSFYPNVKKVLICANVHMDVSRAWEAVHGYNCLRLSALVDGYGSTHTPAPPPRLLRSLAQHLHSHHGGQ